MLEISDALIVYVCDTESISGINRFRKYRLMPMSLLLGASETDVVSSCRDVRGVCGQGASYYVNPIVVCLMRGAVVEVLFVGRT